MAIIATSTVVAAMLVGINNSQNLQKGIAQEVDYPAGMNITSTTITAVPNTTNEYKGGAANSITSITAATTVKAASPNQSTNKEFWINTVHLDGMTNIHPGIQCDTCLSKTRTHPAEQPPANCTIPTGGGFRITLPDK